MEQEKQTGALLDPFDPRDIHLGSLSGSPQDKEYPDSYETDISMIPVLNQKSQPSCVGYARAIILNYFLYKDGGLTNLISPDFTYALSKMFDGTPDSYGTYPRIAALKNHEIGALLAIDFPRDLSLPHAEYIKFDLDQKVKIKAALQKIANFSVIYDTTEAALVAALNEHKFVEITLPCDGIWSSNPIKNKKRKTIGYHRITLIGYERTKKDTFFIFRNSWGESWGQSGKGRFAYSDFKGQIHDAYVFLDIPEKDLAEVKKIPIDLAYNWTKNLVAGSNGPDVTALQYALKLEGCMDILAKADGLFGKLTYDAVRAFQTKYKLKADGSFGPASRAILNQHYGRKIYDGLDRWATAIQNHEGYFAPSSKYPRGSLSWQCNNPGNIRCTGKYKEMADGKCHSLNFCMFKDYATGFEALKILLKDAATGQNKYYKPEMTITQFFKVYAPSGDGNSPETYALQVAKFIGVPVETPIKNLI